MKNITKNIFLNSLVCPRLGWMLRNEGSLEQISEKPLSLAEKFRIEQGLEIGNRARTLYPKGVLIQEYNTSDAVNKTKIAMDDTSVSTIFEATFAINEYVTKVDILNRNGDKWKLVEVKSSVKDKPEFIDDMAYTAMVTKKCGLDISEISLLLISRDFRLGMGNAKLFVEIDHTDDVLRRVKDFESYFEEINKVTSAAEKPELKLQFDCKKCLLFGQCFGENIENHIFDLPRLSKSKFDLLTDENIVKIEDIPAIFPLTEKQNIVKNAVQTGRTFINEKLREELDKILWPVFYLDFETVITALPLYPECAPFTQIVTQYSIHKCSEPGCVIDHREYLADPHKDCRKELAERLIKDLSGEGSIIVYTNFEKTVIKGLGALYPDILLQLNSLISRLVDIEAIIRNNFYHPDFHGSTSIKRTLPVLVPEMTYENLSIGNGSEAIAAFANLEMCKYEEYETPKIKENLLEYCKQDTLAMVKLHERLVNIE